MCVGRYKKISQDLISQQFVMIISHGLPLLVVEEDVGSDLLHPLHCHLWSHLGPPLGHQVTTNQSRTSTLLIVN